MSNKLDQSLDTIMGEGKGRGPRRNKAGGRPARRAATKVTTATAAPVGGVRKNTRAPKGAPTAPAVSLPASGDSKIIVSNLPQDVTETLIKDFFTKATGHVKKVLLSYGPNGRSRGEAQVIFSRPEAAIKAHKDYNDVRVDGRPMKIEIVASTVTVPATKTLSDRMAKPKSAAREKDKPVATKKDAVKPAADGAAKRGRGEKRKSGRGGRPKPKSADELDAEMADYFGGETTNGATANGDAAVNGAAAATNGADTGMTDEVL